MKEATKVDNSNDDLSAAEIVAEINAIAGTGSGEKTLLLIAQLEATPCLSNADACAFLDVVDAMLDLELVCGRGDPLVLSVAKRYLAVAAAFISKAAKSERHASLN